MEGLPFDSYPDGGTRPLGRVRGANCRHEYGLKFMQLTRQTQCAYCSADFAKDFDAWLTMALDHVVPRSVCIALGVQEDWREDCANIVLACAACNSFCNRYKPKNVNSAPPTWEAFLRLRDDIFRQRNERIRERKAAEREFYDEQPWQREFQPQRVCVRRRKSQTP
jgi:hypothetical protein